MRKLTTLILAGSAALAMALPAAAQVYGGYNGGYDRGYDRNYDRGYGYGYNNDQRAAQLMAQYDRLYAQVDRDYRSGRMGQNQARNFFNRIDELRRAINKAQAKHRGYLDQVEYRNQNNALARLQNDYAEYQRYARRDNGRWDNGRWDNGGWDNGRRY